jgi:hypothetical protein
MGFIAGMVKIIVGQNGPKQNAVRLLHNHITAKKILQIWISGS